MKCKFKYNGILKNADKINVISTSLENYDFTLAGKFPEVIRVNAEIDGELHENVEAYYHWLVWDEAARCGISDTYYIHTEKATYYFKPTPIEFIP